MISALFLLAFMFNPLKVDINSFHSEGFPTQSYYTKSESDFSVRQLDDLESSKDANKFNFIVGITNNNAHINKKFNYEIGISDYYLRYESGVSVKELYLIVQEVDMGNFQSIGANNIKTINKTLSIRGGVGSNGSVFLDNNFKLTSDVSINDYVFFGVGLYVIGSNVASKVSSLTTLKNSFANFYVKIIWEEDVSSLIQEGKDRVENATYDEGFNEGFNYGKQAGYDEGITKKLGFPDYLNGVFNTITNVLNIEIFPGFKLLYALAIPVVLGIFGFIIGFFRGG